MTHELRSILEVFESAEKTGLRAVMATVVALEGSSYRKPGVRMLVLENGIMEGAVSGGCVEKEISRQAESVFSNENPRVMVYDGRYRLGCEGVLYILLEPLSPSAALLDAFRNNLAERNPMELTSYYVKKEHEGPGFGSTLRIGDEIFPFHRDRSPDDSLTRFEQKLPPAIRLYVIGGEHDAVILTALASKLGMEVFVVVDPREEKEVQNFPGASGFLGVTPESFPKEEVDGETAVVLMNHSYSKDLQFLIQLQNGTQFYTGLLGPVKRREELLNDLLEHCPETEYNFLDRVHGPAGIDIGAETPQEIAVSILGEILSVHRARTPVKLKDKKGSIHSPSA
jgi:xanthine/CO dehydrogenase XdhC/CoxF family maturation factor